MKFLKWGLAILALLSVIYFTGPKPKAARFSAQLPEITDTGYALEFRVGNEEYGYPVKPDNQARIVWHDSILKQRTRYAVVYLHGFSASQKEGDPVHLAFAQALGANLYLSRLAEHGLQSDEALLNMTATSLWESAKQAYAIGKQLGDSVILMSTSTGGTLSLMLAAQQYPEIAGLVMLSPNIQIKDPNAWLLNNPWGLQIARLVKGSNYNHPRDTTARYRAYWNNPYRLESITELQELVESQMTSATFRKVNQPLLLLYYYRDEAHQDPVVSVEAMQQMFAEVSTPAALKRSIAIPNAGDHVIGSPIKSADVPAVEKECLRFAKEVILKN